MRFRKIVFNLLGVFVLGLLGVGSWLAYKSTAAPTSADFTLWIIACMVVMAIFKE